ncbi:MAG TPA: DUF6098 family protein [Streptosporangiales bacterium]
MSARDDGEAPRLDRLVQLVELLDEYEQLYVRFGDHPSSETGGSIDYESGLRMPGQSVNRLRPPTWWTRPPEDWLARQICQYAHLLERSPRHQGWIVRGTEVGHGPDDEPLLDDVEVVGRIGRALLDEAQLTYQRRFDQGRVSH